MNNIDPRLYPQYNFKLSGVKETYDKYYLAKDSRGELVAVEKKTNTVVVDPLIIDRLKFSLSWVESVKNSISRNTTDSATNERDYEYAFNDEAHITYATMMSCIQKQLLTTGNIDVNEILEDEKKVTYKYATKYIENLFSKERYAKAVDKWARHAIPNALPATKEIEIVKNSSFGLY